MRLHRTTGRQPPAAARNLGLVTATPGVVWVSVSILFGLHIIGVAHALLPLDGPAQEMAKINTFG